MSFFRKKQSKDGQKRLEHQLHLAKHGPLSVVDISECDLVEIPHGTYALCKVLLKEALLVSSNRLKNLKEGGSYEDFAKLRDTLRVFDAHANRLEDLPSEIGQLRKLQVLDLGSNFLTVLPDTIESCESLQTLKLKDNRLKELPSAIGRLCSLRTLDVSGNDVTTLPRSMAKLRCLETLILDVHRMRYPSVDICSQGTTVVMKFLCKESGVDYQPPSITVLSLMNVPEVKARCSIPKLSQQSVLGNFSRSFDEMDNYAKAAAQFQKLKDEKRMEQARLQQGILEAAEQTAKLIADCTSNRQTLLKEIVKEQTELDKKLSTVQMRKDVERTGLLNAISQMENHAQCLVEQILNMNREVRWTEQQLDQQDRKRSLDEGSLHAKYEEYQKLKAEEIRRAMETIMAQNYSLEELRTLHVHEKRQIVDRALEEDMLHNDNVETVLRYKDAMAAKLLEDLSRDQEFQKEALLTLMEQRDARCNRLNHQIALIQTELAQLSQLEMKNRDMQTAMSQSCLEDQRVVLARLLMQLISERESRNKELQKRLVEMEQAREDEQLDFWLLQYQKLLLSKPNVLVDQERQLETEVLKVLHRAEAHDYVPAFARHHITADLLPTLTEQDLQRIGIYQVGMRKAVLDAIAWYLEHEKTLSDQKVSLPQSKERGRTEPSAPTAVEGEQPTVVARFELECAVCLENQCTLVFVPCGHVCCCAACGAALRECPLCRARISSKVDVFAANPTLESPAAQ